MAPTYSLPTTRPAGSARSHGTRLKAPHPRCASDSDPDERRFDEGVGIKTLCGTRRKFGHDVAAVRVLQERHISLAPIGVSSR
jgi:hypothetical protein